VYTLPAAHEGLERYVPNLTFRTIEGGSHWIAEDRPELVNRHIREFLRERAVAFAGSV
jgi:pimeloyl-ACP methyl ester carboxylesterase